MSSRPSSPEGQVTPAQVWSALSLDLRTRVIGLLAQLALNMVTTRPGNECPERRSPMLTRPVLQKIRPDHLDRFAVIYVRQSTLFQVRENTGSTTRQYDLVKRAQDLGWTPEAIQVVDQDQGHSGSSSVGRDGFQWLVAEVGLGHVGAVLSLEVSRLARSCSDWYRLLEICALSDTLVIDDEGVYDPGAHNDRLLLGFKGTCRRLSSIG